MINRFFIFFKIKIYLMINSSNLKEIFMSFKFILYYLFLYEGIDDSWRKKK
jgi:hypothetical protein